MLSVLKKSLNAFKGLKNVGKFSFNDKSIRIYFHHYFVLHQTYLPVWFLEGIVCIGNAFITKKCKTLKACGGMKDSFGGCSPCIQQLSCLLLVATQES